MRIFPPKKFALFFKRPKNMFLCQKLEQFIVGFGRNRPKWAYLAQNGQILVKKTSQKTILRIFPRKKIAQFFKRPTNMYLWRNWGTFIIAFGRNRPKWAYLAQNGQILVKKNAQKVNIKNSHPPKKKLRHFLKDQQICFYGENEEHS